MDNQRPSRSPFRSKLARSFFEYLSVARERFEFDVLGTAVVPEEVDVITLRIKPDIPSEPVEDIRGEEDVEVRFDHKDTGEPRVRVLREDFPSMIHVNPRFDASDPKTICLYETPWPERRLTWNNCDFLARIFLWFRRAAEGTLHQQDQPLEPLFVNSPNEWIFSDEQIRHLTEESKICELSATCLKPDQQRTIWMEARDGAENLCRVKVLGVTTAPVVHGHIRKFPTNLMELLEILETQGDNFLQLLTDHIRDAKPDDEASMMLLVRFPVARAADTAPERDNLWLFGFPESLYGIGKLLGLFSDARKYGIDATAKVLDFDSTAPPREACTSVPLLPIKVLRELNRKTAQSFAGVAVTDRRVMLIGWGALGSQVHMNLERIAWGRWVVVDDDHLLPHNVVRHAASRNVLGWPKSAVAAAMARDLMTEATASHLVCDVLDPKEAEGELSTRIQQSDVILDCSASVAVARHLASDLAGGPRRVSAFIGAGLSSLILLAEDHDRSIRLDWLEMLLFRAALANDAISTALQHNAKVLSYANSCRDKSVQLPQDVVATLAGICSMSLRRLADKSNAVVQCSRIEDDESITTVRINATTPRSRSLKRGAWKIMFDEDVVETMCSLREEGMPRETGGVLVGARDTQRGTIYIVSVLDAPADSLSDKARFERGIVGLRERIETIGRATGGGLEYVGEWHSHPKGASAMPSRQDFRALAELRTHARQADQPVLMAIVGDSKGVTFTLSS